jgi:O-acetyl-ADP-ribose deacetylase (regulator of RNase III)
MIEITHGDLLAADADALVNSVNCVGVMGRGVARQMKAAYPENVSRYKAACGDGALSPGEVVVFDRGGLFGGPDDGPRYILNVATKDHWRDDTTLAMIERGVAAVAREVRARGIASVALPALGCGGGGLAWDAVRPVVEDAFADLPDVRVLLFPPGGGPAAPGD